MKLLQSCEISDQPLPLLTASCRSYSRPRTSPHGSSPAPDDVTTSRMCWASCTGFLSDD